MPKRSAGILMYRQREALVEVLLVHPGGPFWRNKDTAAWSLPKGEYLESDDPLAAAIREFQEETGMRPQGHFLPLGEIRQPGGKLVTAWAVPGDCDAASLKSNVFSMEWPKGSGIMREFPEMDKAEWFDLDRAREKILKGQIGFLDRLLKSI